MALVLKDRVQETTAVVGTGTMTLAGAVLGFQTFAAIGDSNTTYYAVFDLITGDWEVGIGTYTSSGTTLSRTTVLSSSNGGSLVSFAAGTKQVICTYPSERAVWIDSTNTNTVQNVFSSITATTATLTNGTISTAPANPTDIVNKDYADSIASGINFHAACNYATTADLGAATYNNGTLGVGATLTKTSPFATLSVDGGSPTVGQRILVKNQTSGQYNGAYVVTSVGSGAAGWVLTRATDYDTSGSGQNEIDQGDYFLILAGTTNANTSWVQQTALPIVVGTTALVFLQFAAPITYSAGTGLTLSPSTTFNITNTGVTAASYGIAASVPTLAINAQGQITSASNTAIAIAAAAVSGLATSATTDTTNAANITSGTLPVARLSGSYTGITGTGALAAGSLATGFTAVSAPLGGTGQTTYTIGDILYASTTTALSKLAAVAVGNVLISNGVGSAPSWGQVGLATSVSGTLPVANGGTGVTSASGTGSVVLNSGPSITSATLTTPTVGSAGATFNGSTSGTTVFKAAATAGTTTITMPGTTGTMALTSDIPTVSNGTLTMAVSGTGLSGSASFTANQSSASSFTVTSNATNANTASTIVARDASGNFSAGTITAALSGNATTATSATTAGTITSQANSATITAATANTASTIVLRDASGNFSAGTITATLTGNLNGGTLNGPLYTATYDNSSKLIFNSASTYYLGLTGNVSTGGGSLSMVQYNASTGSAAAAVNSYPLLHSGNYTSYAPSLTGSGASGTWGINVTGNAATATNVGGLVANSYVTYGGSATTTAINSYYGVLMGTSANHLQIMADGSGNGGFYRQNSGWPFYYLVSNGGVGIMTSTTSASYALYVAGGIYSTGNITAYSDLRAKKEIVTIDGALGKVNKLRGVYYKAIEEVVKDTAHHDKRQMGVIAQEVLEVVPEVVTYDKENDKYGVSYANMVGLLIEAIKEQQVIIDTQDARIASFEARLAALEAKG